MKKVMFVVGIIVGVASVIALTMGVIKFMENRGLFKKESAPEDEVYSEEYI